MLFEFLESNQISYQRVNHPPVFTCEQAEQLVPRLPGAQTKNLFLRDKKGSRYFLVVVSSNMAVDLKALSSVLGVSNLSFASEERLKECLDLTPGSVSLLGVINDKAKMVKVVIDQELWDSDAFFCHPLVNTSTLLIAKESLVRFLALTDHAPTVISVQLRLDCYSLPGAIILLVSA